MELENQQEQPKRKPTGSTYTEGFDPERIERLKTIVKDFEQAEGKGKRYCIIVDGEMVVPTNTESAKFDNYKRYLLGNSNEVEVRMFFGESPNCNKHIFKTDYKVLNGPEKDVDSLVQEALIKERQLTKIKSLQSELKRKNKKLKQFKELQSQLDEKKLNVKDLIQDGIKVLGQINAMRNGSPVTPIQGVNDSEVEVEIESDSPVDNHIKRMKSDYSDKELEKGIKIWEIFSSHPELQQDFMKIINQKIKKNGKA